jgi:hypothetical protein
MLGLYSPLAGYREFDGIDRSQTFQVVIGLTLPPSVTTSNILDRYDISFGRRYDELHPHTINPDVVCITL